MYDLSHLRLPYPVCIVSLYLRQQGHGCMVYYACMVVVCMGDFVGVVVVAVIVVVVGVNSSCLFYIAITLSYLIRDSTLLPVVCSDGIAPALHDIMQRGAQRVTHPAKPPSEINNTPWASSQSCIRLTKLIPYTLSASR